MSYTPKFTKGIVFILLCLFSNMPSISRSSHWEIFLFHFFSYFQSKNQTLRKGFWVQVVYLGGDLRRQKKALGKVRQRREKKLVRNMSMSKLPCGQLELNPAGYSEKPYGTQNHFTGGQGICDVYPLTYIPIGWRLTPVVLTILHFRLNLTEAEQDSTVSEKASAEKRAKTLEVGDCQDTGKDSFRWNQVGQGTLEWGISSI